VLTWTGERTCLEVGVCPKTAETYLLLFLPAAYVTCVNKNGDANVYGGKDDE